MKNIKYAAAAIALSALSFGAFAAQPVTPAQAESMNKSALFPLKAQQHWMVWKPNWLLKPMPLAQPATASPPLTPTTKLAVPRLSTNNRSNTLKCH